MPGGGGAGQKGSRQHSHCSLHGREGLGAAWGGRPRFPFALCLVFCGLSPTGVGWHTVLPSAPLLLRALISLCPPQPPISS